MKKCPCGHPLKVEKSYNVSLQAEGDLYTCMCKRTRYLEFPDLKQAKFAKYARDIAKVPDECRIKETSIDRYRALADTL